MKFFQDKKDPNILWVRARRCERCGGLITSDEAIKDGYGHHCLMKIKEEVEGKRQLEGQESLFEEQR